MTADRFDQTIREWVTDRTAGRAPRRLHSEAMELVRGRRQRGSWSSALRGLTDHRRVGPVQLGTALRLAALLAVTLLLGVMLGLAAGSRPPDQPSPTPQPTPGAPLLAAGFLRPFTYQFPSDAPGGFHAVVESEDLQEFGYGTIPPSPEVDYLALQIAPRGVVVMALGEPWVDPCPNNHGIRATPAEFLDDLHVFASLASDPVVAVTLDGRAALTTSFRANHDSCPRDFHYDRGPTHSSKSISTLVASQLTVLEVDGATIVIDIWAQTDAEFEAWLPTAREFVDSIHFVGEPSPSATPTPEPTLAAEFVRPFSYMVPAAVKPQWFRDNPAMYAFVDQAPEGFTDVRYASAQASSSRGIAVVSVEALWVNVCRGLEQDRVQMRTPPTQLVEDLDSMVGLTLGPVATTVVGGRPALTAAIDPLRSSCTPAFFFRQTHGLGEDWLVSGKPAVLFVVDVDGVTILIDAWAETDADLATWLPIARQYVDSIQFIEQP